MKLYLLSILTLKFLFIFSQEITITSTEQKLNEIYVNYNFDGPEDLYTINLYVKTKNNSSWGNKLYSVIGDVGQNQTTGKNKRIVWDVKKDRETFVGDWIFGIEVFSKNSESVDFNAPEDVVRNFLEALDNGDFTKAYNMQQIDRLGSESDFCSTTSYGGTKTVIINKISFITKSSIASRVYADYETYDPHNKNWKLTVEYTLNKIQQKWIITEFKNLTWNEIPN